MYSGRMCRFAPFLHINKDNNIKHPNLKDDTEPTVQVAWREHKNSPSFDFDSKEILDKSEYFKKWTVPSYSLFTILCVSRTHLYLSALPQSQQTLFDKILPKQN